ncbi:hypothetical protein EVAR_39954_1 [Eumeta japonica]|uniref:Uncharacterized protein n=1 Tax=Eumeta variegata TaxID=151549 RepID=A0A4C1X540_EUMVA|nr:hypothetical protein EVAR_39954_1 [Eumeta japonica]
MVHPPAHMSCIHYIQESVAMHFTYFTYERPIRSIVFRDRSILKSRVSTAAHARRRPAYDRSRLRILYFSHPDATFPPFPGNGATTPLSGGMIASLARINAFNGGPVCPPFLGDVHGPVPLFVLHSYGISAGANWTQPLGVWSLIQPFGNTGKGERAGSAYLDIVFKAFALALGGSGAAKNRYYEYNDNVRNKRLNVLPGARSSKI